MKPINRVIADLMKRSGETDKDIAKKLKVSPQRLGLYKNGNRQPGIDFVQAWKDAYGEDLLQLVKKDNKTTKETTVDIEEEVPVKEYRDWINDFRLDVAHLREVNLRYLQIIEVLSGKVGATNHA